MSIKYYTSLHQLPYLSETEKATLSLVTERFPFRANDYYLSLINWDDPNDPIRRIIIPCIEELDTWRIPDPALWSGPFSRQCR